MNRDPFVPKLLGVPSHGSVPAEHTAYARESFEALRQQREGGAAASEPQAIVASMARSRAIEVFLNCCNTTSPDRLWVTESWLEPRLAPLRDALSDPITEVQADALRLAVTQQRDLDDVITFLASQPLTWDSYDAVQHDLERARDLARRQDGLIPWEMVRRAANDEQLQAEHAADEWPNGWPQCPGCSRTGRELDRVWVKDRSRRWFGPGGFNGWVFVCRSCAIQVEATGWPGAIID